MSIYLDKEPWRTILLSIHKSQEYFSYQKKPQVVHFFTPTLNTSKTARGNHFSVLFFFKYFHLSKEHLEYYFNSEELLTVEVFREVTSPGNIVMQTPKTHGKSEKYMKW